jgi:hypothetical protein
MTTVFLVVVILCLVTGFVLDFFGISRSTQRRIYWASACLAAVSGFLMVYPNWKTGLGIAALLLSAMTVMAYVSTPYLKIGGKIYALTVADSRPDPEDTHTPAAGHPGTDGAPTADSADPAFDPAPDSYSGMLTATTMWWLLVGLSVIAAVNTYAFLFSDGKAGAAAASAALLVFLAAGTGYGDASWDYPIARRQHLQLGLASLITAGGFALVYLIAYYTARRFPLRRTQSLEYRAHPRHRKPPP